MAVGLDLIDCLCTEGKDKASKAWTGCSIPPSLSLSPLLSLFPSLPLSCLCIYMFGLAYVLCVCVCLSVHVYKLEEKEVLEQRRELCVQASGDLTMYSTM